MACAGSEDLVEELHLAKPLECEGEDSLGSDV